MRAPGFEDQRTERFGPVDHLLDGTFDAVKGLRTARTRM
jgi:hypothetical protein